MRFRQFWSQDLPYFLFNVIDSFDFGIGSCSFMTLVDGKTCDVFMCLETAHLLHDPQGWELKCLITIHSERWLKLLHFM